MSKTQLGLIVSALFLFAFLYFGLDTKPENRKSIERSRALMAESTDIKILLRDAKAGLPAETRNQVTSMETLLAQTPADTLKIPVLEKISGLWYTLERADISAWYAEQIARIKGSEETWSIAATTYSLCIKQASEEKIKSYCSGRAVKAYENAISMNPDNISHKLNLALSYADFPPKDNPMKGVMMLLDLNRKHPEHVPVILNLAKLGLQTGQVDKAIQRLLKAQELDADNVQVHCLLAEAYQQKGDQEKAGSHLEKCNHNLIRKDN